MAEAVAPSTTSSHLAGSIQRIFTIAFNTYRESLRARILIGLSGIAFAVAFYSIVVGAYTLHHGTRVVSDLGAASISVFSILVGVLIGATSLYRELEQKTIFPVLARPVLRGEYLIGKFLGTLLTLSVFIMADAGILLLICGAQTNRFGTSSIAVISALGLLPVLAFAGLAWARPSVRTIGPIPWSACMLAIGAFASTSAVDDRRVILGASLLTLFEMSIVSAVATLFSSFSTPFLSAIFTLSVFIIGRSADLLAKLPVKYFGTLVSQAGKVLARAVPNLQIYVPPRPLLTGEAASVNAASYFGMAFLNSLGWTAALLALAIFIFKRRDFL